MMNGSLEKEIVTNAEAFIHRKLQGVESNAERMDIIWKAILCRLPKVSEEPLFEQGQNNIIWALLNSNEFKFVR